LATNNVYLLSARKLYREFKSSILLVLVVTAGAAGWIVIQSIDSSAYHAEATFANTIGPYVVVYDTGQNQTLKLQCLALHYSVCTQRLPESVVSQLSAIHGIEAFYPLVINYTGYLRYNVTEQGQTCIGNVCTPTNQTIPRVITTWGSAVLNDSGFPTSLLVMTSGRVPMQGEAGYIISSSSIDPALNATNPAYLNKTFLWEFTAGKKVNSPIIPFNATFDGIFAQSPVIGGKFSGIEVLWNSQFLEHVLGSTLYNESFGGPGANYIIIKADNLSAIPSVVQQVNSILNSTGWTEFQPRYDQAFISSLQNLQSSSLSLSSLAGYISLASGLVAELALVYLTMKRRGWESGLLVSQGWTSGSISRFYFSYYLMVGVISYALAVLASLVVTQFYTFSVDAFGTVLAINATPEWTTLALAFPLVTCISIFGSVPILVRTRWRRLDALLREY